MNYNHFLRNSIRTDLIGRNMSTSGKIGFYKPRVEKPISLDEKDDYWNSSWDAPKFGMSGQFECGHDIDMADVISLEIYADGKLQSFIPVRNEWTPAYMETYYRCKIEEEYYHKSGCISVREKKCINEQDVFMSSVTVTNNKKQPISITVKVVTSFAKLQPPLLQLKYPMAPRALETNIDLDVLGALIIYPYDEQYANEITVTMNAYTTYSFNYAFAFHPSDGQIAIRKAQQAVTNIHFFAENEMAFNNWIDTYVPYLETQNDEMLKVYYYRWFLVWRNLFTPQDVVPNHIFKGSCFYECAFGNWFGTAVGASVPMQISESQWMKNSQHTYDFLKSWCEKIGNTHGYIQATPFLVWQLHCLHPNEQFIKENYSTFVDYAKSRLQLSKNDKRPIVRGSWVTACEYQPSFYQYTNPKWDWRYDVEGEKLYQKELTEVYRVDDIVFSILNLNGCVKMAQLFGYDNDVSDLAKLANHLIEKLKSDHWDENTKIFYDVDVQTSKRCNE